MSLTHWNPWLEIEKLRAETDELLNSFLDKVNHPEDLNRRVDFIPQTDVVETPTEFRLYLSVPGLIEEEIELVIENSTVIIRGEREPPYDATLAKEKTTEWRYGFFERQFEFSHPILIDSVYANFDAGVLAVFLPKQLIDRTERTYGDQ